MRRRRQQKAEVVQPVTPTDLKDMIWCKPEAEAWWKAATDRDIVTTTDAACKASNEKQLLLYETTSDDEKREINRDRNVDYHTLPATAVGHYVVMGQYQVRQWCSHMVARGAPDGTVDPAVMDDLLTHLERDCWSRGAVMEVRAIHGLPQPQIIGMGVAHERTVFMPNGQPASPQDHRRLDSCVCGGGDERMMRTAMQDGRVTDNDVLRLLIVYNNIPHGMAPVVRRIMSSDTTDARLRGRATSVHNMISTIASDDASWGKMPSSWRADRVQSSEGIRGLMYAWAPTAHQDDIGQAGLIGLRVDASHRTSCMDAQRYRQLEPLLVRIGREPQHVRVACVTGMTRCFLERLMPYGRDVGEPEVCGHAWRALRASITTMETHADDGDAPTRIQAAYSSICAYVMPKVMAGDLKAQLLLGSLADE